MGLTMNPVWPGKIISFSPGFSNLCGPCIHGANFMDWIDENIEFNNYIQSVVSLFLSNSHFKRELVLQKPFAKSADLKHVIGYCRVDAIYASGLDDDGQFALRLSLHDIRQKFRRAHRGKTLSMPSRSSTHLEL